MTVKELNVGLWNPIAGWYMLYTRWSAYVNVRMYKSSQQLKVLT